MPSFKDFVFQTTRDLDDFWEFWEEGYIRDSEKYPERLETLDEWQKNFNIFVALRRAQTKGRGNG